MIQETQLPACFREVVDEQVAIFEKGPSITFESKIPEPSTIPIENPQHWLKIPEVICVFVDMKGSTQFSAFTHDTSTAGAYQLFTGTAVRLFREFEAPYIDLKGDGVLALFDSNQPYRALAATITFKTFAHEVFVPRIKKKTGLVVGSHLGIDQRTVLVRRLGLKRRGGRTDRQNEVWAGKPVNMASKLAAISEDNELLVSDRFFANLKDELVLKSCGCPSGDKGELWTAMDVSDDERFDFDIAYRLSSNWCSTHGKEYCDSILRLDKN
ncbi:MAG TPA: hypothetical protein PKD55_17915 [Bellilinea sp.]|nr:hypothetical protein [Bellilinea sp.]